MDECYVVEVDENYPNTVPVVEPGYENVNIVHVFSTNLFSNSSQVITVTPSTSQSKPIEMHPLEAEVQKSLEVRRQNELARLTSNSVIQTLAQATQPGRRLPNIAPPLQTNLRLESIEGEPTHGKEFTKVDALARDSQKVLWLPDVTHPETFAENTVNEDLLSQKDDFMKVDAAQIPLTVQNCCQTSDPQEATDQNSGSEDEIVEMKPVYDDEPDPETAEPVAVEDTRDMDNRCYMCFKKFRQRKNMYAHIRKIHSSQPLIQGGIVCPLCKMHALRQEHLRNHLETLHDIKISKEERQFNTMEEFLQWKEFVERETLSLFISKSAPKLLAFNQTKVYYKCHRSGCYFGAKEENRKKKLKAQGSSKIGATCPAAMEVIENIHGVTVTFWTTHVGHDHDIKHLMLNKEDKAVIGDLLKKGLSMEEVLENIQNDRSVPSRLDVVSKQDLRNMKNDVVRSESPPKVKISMGRKPKKERMLRSASRALVLDKAEHLLNLLRTTQVMPEFRPQVCLMIDNIICTVKRRTVNSNHGRRRVRDRLSTTDESDASNGRISGKALDEDEEEDNEQSKISINSPTSHSNLISSSRSKRTQNKINRLQ